MTIQTLAAGVLCLGLAAPGFADNRAAPDPLRQFSSSVETLVRRVSPSVVQILVWGYGPVSDSRSSDADLVIAKQRSMGSGVVIDSSGYIITNAHVVNGGRRIEVIVPGAAGDEAPIQSLVGARGRTLEARVIGVAPEVDLALLKVEATGLPALPVANYDTLRQGEVVFAFGSPEGLGNSVTMGVVSSVARQPSADRPMVYIQTDAPINHGNSGGPLVNVEGEIVGINTFILSDSGGSQGLGFAIPSTLVTVASRQLREYGHMHQGEIGANLQTITPDLADGLSLPQDSGVIVSDLLPDGPAAQAGLRVGDIIVTVDGRPMESLPLLAFYLYTRNPGDRLGLGLLRQGRELHLDVRIIERPHDLDGLADRVEPERSLVRQLGVLGITIDDNIADLVANIRERSGVIVAARTPDPPEDIPLSAGDIVHAVNGVPVSNVEDLRALLDGLQPYSAVVLQIERDGRLMFVTFELD